MIEGAVANRYARALLSIAEEQNALTPIGGDIEALERLIEDSAELKLIFRNPMVQIEELQAIMHAVAEQGSMHPLTRSFIKLIVERGRLHYLAAISQAYRRLADEKMGRIRAEVRSTAPLMPQEIEQIRAALTARTGKEVSIETEVDPGLLGGVVAKVGDTVYDSSLRSHLERLKQSILSV